MESLQEHGSLLNTKDGMINMNINSEIIGWLGSAVIMLSFIPKKVKLIRIINIVGCVLWVWYGIITHAPSVWVMNTIILFLHFYHLIKK